VEVSTSLGDVSGTVDLPVDPAGVSYSDTAQIALGEDLTVSWSGGDADFYFFELEYEYDFGWDYFDTLTVGTSVTIDGAFFAHDGLIDNVDIQPINGPAPIAGSTGNMSGDGTGFLFHIIEGVWDDPDIQVGAGLSFERPDPAVPDAETRRTRARRALLEANGLPAGLAH